MTKHFDVQEKHVNFGLTEKHIPSEMLKLKSLDKYLLPTLNSKPQKPTQNPMLCLTWDSEQEEFVLSNHLYSQTPLIEHGRNIVEIKLSQDSLIYIFVDHGHDFPPFEGGFDLQLDYRNGQLSHRPLLKHRTSSFDCAATSNIGSLGHLIFVTKMVKPDFQLFSFDENQKVTDLTHLLPDPQRLQRSFLSCLFVDIDGDGQDELILGSKMGQDQDIILKFQNNRFSMSDIALPIKRKKSWDTLMIAAEDLTGNGRPDLISLSHDHEIRHGSIEIYLNQGSGKFARLKLPDELEHFDRIENQWIHRVLSADLFGSGKKDLILHLKRSDPNANPNMEQVLIYLNIDGINFKKLESNLPFLTRNILGVDLHWDSRQRKNKLLVMGYDGNYLILDPTEK